MQTAFFLSIVKQSKFQGADFVSYKKKIKHVSSKINKWHLKITGSANGGSEEAVSDLDFVQNMTSPDQFSESSEEEMIQTNGVLKMSQSSSEEKSSF